MPAAAADIGRRPVLRVEGWAPHQELRAHDGGDTPGRRDHPGRAGPSRRLTFELGVSTAGRTPLILCSWIVGRVVAIREDGCDVLVAGVGVLRYARDEILPRRPGQVRFAEQRAADWEALRRCMVLEATVGSRAWGLANQSSDTDLRGI